MDQNIYANCVAILKEELIPALGCTEPIALAYAAAKARETLGQMPSEIEVCSSGNIVKNVKAVTVPKSGGMRGIAAAAVLGVVGGQAQLQLEVLDHVTPDQIRQTQELLDKKICRARLVTGVDKLYIQVRVTAPDGQSASVTIEGHHTNITRIEKNGQVLYDCPLQRTNEEKRADRSCLSVRTILEFAQQVDLADVAPVLERQVECNTKIAEKGLADFQGVGVASALLAQEEEMQPYTRARAMAAAASEGRMSGCSLPVVINSGSGNQGITVSVPVAVYARAVGASHEQLLRALVISNLISVHLKKYIGDLSAFCGAVTAACGAGAAVCFLENGGYEEISDVITNTLAAVSGIVCDGAKPSCAAKISSALDAAFLAVDLAKKHHVFHEGDGLVGGDVEQTIRNIGCLGREGMEETDTKILELMMA